MRLAQVKTVVQACKQMGRTEQIYYRWKKENWAPKMDHAKRLKAMKKENVRLKNTLIGISLLLILFC